MYGQGVRGFWRGNGLNVLKSSPEFAIKFSVYDYVKRVLKSVKDDGHVGSYDRFMAGAVAGVCSQSSMYPLEARKIYESDCKCSEVRVRFFLDFFLTSCS